MRRKSGRVKIVLSQGGAPLPCSRCGRERPAAAAACPHCGADLSPFPGHTLGRESLDFEETLLERLTILEEQARKGGADFALLFEMVERLEAEREVEHAALQAVVETLGRRRLLPAGLFRSLWAAKLAAGLSAAAFKEHYLRLQEQLAAAPLPAKEKRAYQEGLRQAESLLLAGEIAAACRAFARLHARAPSAPLAELLGQAALTAQEYARASRYFQQALPGPDMGSAGQAGLLTGSSAGSFTGQAAGLAATGLATAEYLRGRYISAKAASLLIYDPFRRRLLQALIALAGGAPREAAGLFAQLIESPAVGRLEGVSILYFWARALAAAGEDAAAAAALDEALTRDPHHRSALAFRAYLAARAGAKGKARELYAALTRLDPEGESSAHWRAGSKGRFPGAPPPFTGAGADDLLLLLGMASARAREIVREAAGPGLD